MHEEFPKELTNHFPKTMLDNFPKELLKNQNKIAEEIKNNLRENVEEISKAISKWFSKGILNKLPKYFFIESPTLNLKYICLRNVQRNCSWWFFFEASLKGIFEDISKENIAGIPESCTKECTKKFPKKKIGIAKDIHKSFFFCCKKNQNIKNSRRNCWRNSE